MMSRYYGVKIALMDHGGTTFTFDDVERVAISFASSLLESGVSEGAFSSVFSSNSAREVILFFAAQKIGSILVPHNLRLSSEEVIREFGIIKPKLAVLGDGIPKELENVTGQAGIKTLNLNRMRDNLSENISLRDTSLEDTALIIFTGGTTGEPKGAKIPLRALLFNSINTIMDWKLAENDTSLLSYPLFHTGGWNVLTIPLFLAGGKSILTEKIEPKYISDIITRNGVTV